MRRKCNFKQLALQILDWWDFNNVVLAYNPHPVEVLCTILYVQRKKSFLDLLASYHNDAMNSM